MSRIYLKPGDTVQALCDLTLAREGGWISEVIDQDTILQIWTVDHSHPEGGEWAIVAADLEGSPGTNPHFGEYYYEEKDLEGMEREEDRI